MNQDEANSKWIANYIEFLLNYRLLVFALSLVTLVFCALGIKNLSFSTDYRVYFGKDNPDLLAFNKLEDIYTKGDTAIFALKPRDGDIFSANTLNVIRELTKQAWQIPYSIHVNSISNFQHTWAKGDELIVEELIPEGEISKDLIARAKRVALSDPTLYPRLISKDGKTTAVVARINLPGQSGTEMPEVASFVEKLRDNFHKHHPEFSLHISGAVMLNNAFIEAPLIDAKFIMPFVVIVFFVAMSWFFRSVISAVVTLLVVIFSALSAMGIYGLLGGSVDSTSAAAPTIILTLAIADSVHIIVSFLSELSQGKEKKEALFESFLINTKPVFLTTVTTAVGFLSLNFSDAPPFHRLGNITAIGIVCAWVYSMTFLPVALSILPVKRKKTRLTAKRISEKTAEFTIVRPKTLLFALGALSICLLVASNNLQLNERYHEYFSKTLEFRRDTDFMLENLGGFYEVHYSLEAGESYGISEPAFLGKVDAFASWLRKRAAVHHVNTLSDLFKRLNKNMHEDDEGYYRLPDSRELAAQFLLLYEMSLPYGLDINDQINVDKSATKVTVIYKDVDIKTLQRETREASKWLIDNGTDSMKKSRGTGTALMFGNISRRNIDSMIVGTTIGFLSISMILCLALKSFRLGIISLVPNILPAAMAFGVWAILVQDVGLGISIIASLSIGIIVDDTVHFLSKYQRARSELGYSVEDAVRYSFSTVGAALIGTTVIIAAGFAMLGFSMFSGTRTMGLITSIAIIFALITDFFLLPALLLILDRRRG